MARFRSMQLIPLGVMLALASLTFWLLQINQRQPQPVVARSQAHLPDYFAQDFSISMLDATGHTQYWINAAMMVHYEDGQNTEVISPTISLFIPDQPAVTSVAKRGTINRDGSIVDLYDNVRVTRAPGNGDKGMEVRSQHFRVFVNDDRVVTEKPVKLLRGESVVTANGMTYNHVSRKMYLFGQVRGMIAASDLAPINRSFR